jgi:NADPH-dependent 2,4-dienoyl-CoA reductase/sulfur reductase-like enzyme/rhodanese-related sulfurtransferase
MDVQKKDMENNLESKNSKDKKIAGKKIVIIGGISAGTSAAAKARRLSDDAEIVIYEKYKYISYATCGLPYFVSGKIPALDNLLVNTVKQFELRFNMKVNTLSEVIKINPENKSLIIKDLNTDNLFNETYDKLIIATGTTALKFNREILTAKNVFMHRTIDDAIRLKDYLEETANKPEKSLNAVIIGGGFIGLELIEAFLAKGFKITIIEKTNQILPLFDSEIIEYLESYLLEKGVSILKKEEVKYFKKDDNDILIKLNTSSGKEFSPDVLIFSIGAKPEVKLAQECGIVIGSSGAIIVDEYLNTSAPDIYAAGDCCECKNFINGNKQSYNLASIANIQGRCAGYNAAGGSSKYTDAIPTSIIKILDVAIGKTGMSLKEAKSLGLNSKKIELHSLHHAGYYPGASMMHMMLIYNEDSGDILGFEAIGKEGIDKKTDIISVAMRARMKIWELVSLNLSYQPAYGSAKDPINILGMIGENIFKKEVKFIDPEELKEKLANSESIVVLDVRTRKEYGLGHIDTAINIPIDELRDNIDKLDKDWNIIAYCRTSYRSYLAYRILKNKGFNNVWNLNGSYLSWVRKM